MEDGGEEVGELEYEDWGVVAEEDDENEKKYVLEYGG